MLEQNNQNDDEKQKGGKVKIIYLEWHDAFCNPSWLDRNVMKDAVCDYEAIVRQSGFLIEETKKYIIVAGSWKPAHKYGDEEFSGIHKIPKTWIRNRKTLREVK